LFGTVKDEKSFSQENGSPPQLKKMIFILKRYEVEFLPSTFDDMII